MTSTTARPASAATPLYRDMRTGPSHPPNSDVVFDVVGRTPLNLLGWTAPPPTAGEP